MDYSLTMTTTATREHAETLAEALVVNRLAACVQIAEVSSVFRWNGTVSKEREFLLMIKGPSELFPRLREFVLANHQYDLPELVRLDIADGSLAYLAWMRDATQNPQPGG